MATIVKMGGKIEDVVAAFKAAKTDKTSASGRLAVGFADTMDGLNVRSVYGSPKGMFSLFDKFTRAYTESLKAPIVDFQRGAVVATNGWEMLLCDIPEEMRGDRGVAEGAGFVDEEKSGVCWWNCIPDRIVTDYSLACLKEIAVIERGGKLHSDLMAMEKCAKAYEHTDEDGCYHTIYVWFGDKLYNVRQVARLVTAVFKLGNRKVGIYEQTGYLGMSAVGNAPMHIIGIERDKIPNNNSRGLVMPIRHYGMETAPAFVFPVEGKGANAA